MEKNIIRALKVVAVLALLGLGALLYALLPDNTPLVPIETPTPTPVTQATCSACDHICHECHHSPHIIARGFYCQECAACETGCSGLDGEEQSQPCAKAEEDVVDAGARLNEIGVDDAEVNRLLESAATTLQTC